MKKGELNIIEGRSGVGKSIFQMAAEHGLNGNDVESVLACLEEKYGVEVDTESGAIYIRFNNKHVFQTKRINNCPYIVADLDANRDFVGFEIVP
jgi:uncharacterized protein YuzE